MKIENTFHSQIFSLLATVIVASISQAQESTEIPPVTISAYSEEDSLTQPELTEARKQVSKIPGGATVLDAEEYRRGRVSTVKDALDYAPGVFIQSRFGAEESRVSIRGSGLQRTFHGRGIKFLQDGVPLNLADGSFDFQAVEPLASEYIEVLRGANASKYGAATLGGSVNFVSRTGYNSSLGLARLEAGNFGYGRALLSSGAVHGPYDYSVSLSGFVMDGFRQHSRQNTQRVFSNAGWKISSRLESRFFLTYVDTDSQLPGNLTKEELDRDPTLAQRSATATSDVITSNYKRDFKLFRWANKTTYKIDEESRIDTSLFWSSKDLHHPIFNVLNNVSDDFGVDTKFSTTTPLLDRANSFYLGLSAMYGTLVDKRYQNVFGEEGAPTADNLQSAYSVDVFAENQHEWIKDFHLVTGLQLSTAFRGNKDRFPVAGSNLDNTDKDYYSELLPRLGIRYDLNPTTQVFSNYSFSFEAPSFGELTTVANQTGLLDLKVQTAKTFEVGSRGSEGSVSWDVAYYFANVENELLSYEVTPGVSRTLNADSTHHQGLELGVDVDLGQRFVLKQNYLMSEFRFDDDETYGNGRLAGIPPHFYRVELRLDLSRGYYVAVNSEASLAKYPVDLANTLFANPYATFGMKAGIAKSHGFSAFIEGKNLTDQKYAATTGVISRANSTNQAQFLPGDGVSIYMGLQWSL